MATLKEHQAAMVDLLANGSGIPASASRLAHAVFDILGKMLDGTDPVHESMERFLREEATTPGLNDKALSKREKAVKTDSHAKWPTPAEQRVKELENTIRQLKANNAKLKSQNEDLRNDIGAMASRLHTAEKQLGPVVPEQAGCRKYDTQPCGNHNVERIGGELIRCDCGAKR